MKTGSLIRKLRKEKGMTQEQLGLLTGVQKSAVAKWESGRVVNFKHSVLTKLSEVLDVPVSYFLCNEPLEEDDSDLLPVISKKDDSDFPVYENGIVERKGKYSTVSNMEIGRIIKIFREQKNITLREFEKRSGCTRTFINRLENGTTKLEAVSLQNALDLADAMNLTLDELITMTKDDDEERCEFKQEMLVTENSTVSVPLFSSVPKAIDDSVMKRCKNAIQIPSSWLENGCRYAAISAEFPEMYPKYLPGDIVLLQLTDQISLPGDFLIRINGSKPMIRTLSKADNKILLSSRNPEYQDKTCSNPDDITVLGKIQNIIRDV